MTAAAARVKTADLKNLFNRLAHLSSEDNAIFIKVIGENKLQELVEIVQKSNFDTLQDEGFGKLLDFFRVQHFADGKSGVINPILNQGEPERLSAVFDLSLNPKTSPEKLSAQKAKFVEDINILKVVHGWNEFGNENEPELAISEFLARRAGYAHLRQGLIISIPAKEHKGASFYTIENIFDAPEFAYCILTGLAKEKRNDAKFVARGTVMLSNESWAGNFEGPASGLVPFKKYENQVLANLVEACKSAGEKFTVDFIGHSQGGAIAQHTSAAFAHLITEDIANSNSSEKMQLWSNLKKVNVYPWNSPAYTKEQEQQFANDLEILSKNPNTTNIEFDYSYPREYTDIVHTFGTVFSGRFKKI